MKTRAIALLTAIMMSSATVTVFAADSMKHDMQRDLHERMGMAENADKAVTPNLSKAAIYVRRDMQSDLQAKWGLPPDNDTLTPATSYKSPTDEKIYKP